MFMEQKRTLSLLVDNTPGLLSRVAGLFSRRGYNIETITAGVTADPRYTRMTVVLYCSDEMILLEGGYESTEIKVDFNFIGDSDRWDERFGLAKKWRRKKQLSV